MQAGCALGGGLSGLEEEGVRFLLYKPALKIYRRSGSIDCDLDGHTLGGGHRQSHSDSEIVLPRDWVCLDFHGQGKGRDGIAVQQYLLEAVQPGEQTVWQAAQLVAVEPQTLQF